MNETELTKGDRVLLFDKLPYDFQADMPFTVAPGLDLRETPFKILRATEEDSSPYFFLPNTALPGAGINHCCLVHPFASSDDSDPVSHNIFFNYLCALRLLDPAYIAVSSEFEYGGPDRPFVKGSLYQVRTSWHPRPDYFYDKDRLLQAGDLLSRLSICHRGRLSRLKYACVLFSQVTLGLASTYQLCVLGIYAALEALFAPKSKPYSRVLGRRITRFLVNYLDDSALEDWIVRNYERERHGLSHGFWTFSRDQNHHYERHGNFGTLHELLRLSLLGFLSQDEEQLSFFASKNLQAALDSLSPAEGVFLKAQRMWTA